MDERQQQLVAAAEALRKWVYAQRATWAQGYPQSLVHGQPQLSASGGATIAVSMPTAAVNETISTPAADWSEPESVPSSSDAVTDLVGSTVEKATNALRASWKMFAAVAAVAVVAFLVRLAWPSAHQNVSSKPAAARETAKRQPDAKPKERAAMPAPAARGGAAKGTGQLQVESNPAGAHVLVDGKDRGVTPLTLDAIPVGSHKVVIRGDQGSVLRTVTVAAGEVAQLNESIYSGWLHVTAPFEVRLSEGNKAITLDDSNQVLLPPGPHDIRFENRALGLREVRHVEVRPGETSVLSLEAPTSRLTVTSSEPATVAIDGEQVGETPLTDHVVKLGTRDVTVTSASGDTRHQTLTVTTKPVQLDVDFSKR